MTNLSNALPSSSSTIVSILHCEVMINVHNYYQDLTESIATGGGKTFMEQYFGKYEIL